MYITTTRLDKIDWLVYSCVIFELVFLFREKSFSCHGFVKILVMDYYLPLKDDNLGSAFLSCVLIETAVIILTVVVLVS